MKKKKVKATPKNYSRLGINIQHLRENRRETQEELGAAIGVSKAAISNYETGERIPQRDELDALAAHFNLTISKLRTGDFSHLNDNNDILINDPNNKKLIWETLLPIFYSDSAMENENFKRAYEIHIEIFEMLCNSNDLPSLGKIEYLTKLYQQAAQEKIIDASANLLWWPMFHSISLCYPPISDSSCLYNPEATLQDMYRAGLMPSVEHPENPDFEETKEKVLDTYRRDIILNIYHLKNSNDLVFTDLADYYIALGYIYDFLNDTLSTEENCVVGKEMLQMCWLMRNHYAENYYRLFIFPEEDEEENEEEKENAEDKKEDNE